MTTGYILYCLLCILCYLYYIYFNWVNFYLLISRKCITSYPCIFPSSFVLTGYCYLCLVIHFSSHISSSTWYILQVWHLHMWNIVYIPFCIYIVSYLISIMQSCTYMFNICQTLTFISLLLCTLSLTFAYSYIQVYISAFYPFVCLSNDLLYVTLWHLYPQIVPLVISIRLHVVYILYIGQIFT